MNCPRCGSTNVNITMVMDSARTRSRGCLWGILRSILIVCTLGLWRLIGRSKSKTKFQNHKEAICQNCGHNWRV